MLVGTWTLHGQALGEHRYLELGVTGPINWEALVAQYERWLGVDRVLIEWNGIVACAFCGVADEDVGVEVIVGGKGEYPYHMKCLLVEVLFRDG